MSEAASPPLDFLEEPAFLVAADGAILTANAAARRAFGDALAGRPLAALAADPPDAVAAFLRRASGSSAPLPGAFAFSTQAGPRRMRVHGARLPGVPPRLVLRCLPEAGDRFEALSHRVRELDAELRLRAREKASLEALLAQNRTLLQELQHRVRNTIQMLMTLIKLSARGRVSPEVAAVVELAELRLHAMAASQEAMTRSQDGFVAIKPMIDDLLHNAYGATGPAEVDIDDGAGIDMAGAHCLALLFVEFVGLPRSPAEDGRVRARLLVDGDRARLTIERTGAGHRPDVTLLRSLVRQMGATHDEAATAQGAVYGLEFRVRAWRNAA